MKRLFPLLLSLALLSGCGGVARPDAPAQPSPAEAAQTAPAQAVPAQTTPAEPDSPSPAPEEPEETPSQTAVENNGGQFLGLGDRVYFRRYSPGALDSPQLWGDFLSAWPEQSVPSELCCYDAATGQVTSLFPDAGFGPLWYGDGRFYLSRSEGGGRACAYTVTLEGESADLQEGGRVAGLSSDGRFAAVTSTAHDDWSALTLYRGTEPIAFAAPKQDAYFQFGGFAGDAAIYLCHDYSANVSTLWQLTEKGTLCLGTLPHMGYYYNPPQLEQVVSDAKTVSCLFAWYDGTAQILDKVWCGTARVGRKGSLVPFGADLLDGLKTEYGFAALPRLALNADGTAAVTDRLPGEIFLSEGSWGDLLACGDPPLRLAAELLADPEEIADARFVVQSMEHVGGAAYLRVAACVRSPEDDVGWRWAYALADWYDLRLPLVEDAPIETLTGPEWTGSFG